MKKSELIVLGVIFLLVFYMRTLPITPGKILPFDPVFQYRFTKYFVQWGFLPEWDELTYYVGRENINPPLMYYLTGLFYFIFGGSLFTVAAYASALYGALIVIPAFLLGRELSNRYGGYVSAVLVGTAPQILSRTFGGSYDTDQLVLFFILLTIYLSVVFIRKRNVESFSLMAAGFIGFMFTWLMFWYTYFAGVMIAGLYMIVTYIRERKFDLRIPAGFAALFFVLITVGSIGGVKPIYTLSGLLGFATNPGQWIVTKSIAELQPLSSGAWLPAMMAATGNFNIGGTETLFLLFGFLILISLSVLIQKNHVNRTACIIILALAALITTKGIRFTEFSSAFFLILAGTGFGMLMERFKDVHAKKVIVGFGAFLAFVALSTGFVAAQNYKVSSDPDWDAAWEFLKNRTPELSLVGTWWDPGHMITGLAERRVIADGAHCGDECYYGINTRIVDLGRVFMARNETEAVKILRKYKGTSPEIYWIASDDLIDKFQWLQYYGTGCNALKENCPLYYRIFLSDYGTVGSVPVYIYPIGTEQRVLLFDLSIPVPVLEDRGNYIIFSEVIFKFGNTTYTQRLEPEGANQTLSTFGVNLVNQTLPYSVWIGKGFIVLIPQELRDIMFTKQFFLEGKDLKRFKLVFSNDKVKIFKVDDSGLFE
ncbi:MAG: hypothetical protein GXO63_00410 [Candidatus Micrarchaeota archaeon]|nr:hypothetical protein [Candidatus Micrarchaeota archaeon]